MADDQVRREKGGARRSTFVLARWRDQYFSSPRTGPPAVRSKAYDMLSKPVPSSSAEEQVLTACQCSKLNTVPLTFPLG